MATTHSPASTWLDYARQIVERAARHADPAQVQPPPGEPPPHSGVFVTLHKLKRLRGCMGTLDASLPLAEAIRHAAICAAMQDPRFPPLEANELPHVRVELSVMSPPEPLASVEDLQLGRDGIIVQRSGRRGLFLPQVATEHHLDKETFLARCCSEKAGLPPDAWRDPATEVLRFTTQVWKEPQ